MLKLLFATSFPTLACKAILAPVEFRFLLPPVVTVLGLRLLSQKNTPHRCSFATTLQKDSFATTLR